MPRGVDESNPVVLILEEFLASRHRLQDAVLALDAEQFVLNAASLGNETHQCLGLVRVELVKNKDPSPIGVGIHRTFDVCSEVFLGSRQSDRWNYHFAGGHLEVGDQTERTMTTIFEFDTFSFTRPCRQSRMNALNSLNSGLFVRTDDVRAILVKM